MSVMSDKWFISQREHVIDPFYDHQVKEDDDGKRVLSYGVSSYGYDIRCSDEYFIFTNVNTTIVDPLNFDPKAFVEHKGEYCIIPPNSFALTRSVEYIRVPRDMIVVCIGKSTYARVGIICNVTPLEPGWEGHITIELSNTTPLPAKVYSNQGVAQLLFMKGDQSCLTSYADRRGKYQGQIGITLPK